jgi:hypothetical protein
MSKPPDWKTLEALTPAIREFQALAAEHGIDDIFQDNGGKILQMLLARNLQAIPGREGADAVDVEGREYELKGVDIWLTAGFSTNHHINIPIIEKYRKARWVDLMAAGAIRAERAKQSANRRKAKAASIAALTKDPAAGDNPVASLRGRKTR